MEAASAPRPHRRPPVGARPRSRRLARQAPAAPVAAATPPRIPSPPAARAREPGIAVNARRGAAPEAPPLAVVSRSALRHLARAAPRRCPPPPPTRSCPSKQREERMIGDKTFRVLSKGLSITLFPPSPTCVHLVDAVARLSALLLRVHPCRARRHLPVSARSIGRRFEFGGGSVVRVQPAPDSYSRTQAQSRAARRWDTMSRQTRVRYGIGGDGIIDADGKLNGDTVDVEAVSVERCLSAAFTAPLDDDSADQATVVRRLAYVIRGVRQLQASGVLVTGRLYQTLAPGQGGLAEWAESLLATVSDACAGLFSADDAEFMQADAWRRVCASALGAAAVAAGWLLEGVAGRRGGSDAYPDALHDVVSLLHDALLNVPAAVGVTHTAPGVDRIGGSDDDDDDENEPDGDRDENGKAAVTSLTRTIRHRGTPHRTSRHRS
eukprot:ctg_2858.g786